MISDVLIIADDLLEPPSEIMAFRTVTMLTHYDFHMDNLLLTTQEMKDLYYHWMKARGLMDYIDYIIDEKEEERGIKVNVVAGPDTIVVKYIRLENQMSLLRKIKSLLKY